MKRAAITGIAGQDGTYLARLLLRQGYQLDGLLQFPYEQEAVALRQRFSLEEMEKVRWHSGSLEDPISIVRFLKSADPDEIYHLAGLSDSRHSFHVPEESVLSITLGTVRLLESARVLCPKARIFLASSAEVFGVPEQTPQDENTLMRPFTPYGIAKLAADQFGRLHRERYGQFVSVGILYNHESPLRPVNYLSRKVARAVAAIKQKRQHGLQVGPLESERDWSDARDFVRGFWLALQAQAPGEFVFASGTRRKVADLVECAFNTAGLDYQKYIRVTSGKSDTQQVTTGLCGNPRKAETELGWKREWTFEQTVEDLVRAELEDRPIIQRSDPTPARQSTDPSTSA